MLKVNQIGSNMTELEVNDKTILISYKTPVAVHVTGKGFTCTDKQWSVTTSKHITKWLAANGSELTKKTCPKENQSFFDNLLDI